MHSQSSSAIAIIGAGVLGRRVALMYAKYSTPVRIYDTFQGSLDSARTYITSALAKDGRQVQTGNQPLVSYHVDGLEVVVKGVWMVIEALPEKLPLKIEVIGNLDAITDPSTIIASNSSSYSTRLMLAKVKRPQRVVNTHYYMPPDRNGVEIMSCGHTDPAIIEKLMVETKRHGFVPFHVKKDSLGFIFNRLWAAIKRESLAIVADGVGDPVAVDTLFQSWFRSELAPFMSMDDVGLDTVLNIEEHYAEELGPSVPEGPRRLLREMIAKGKLGRKSGDGFYEYDAQGERILPEALRKVKSKL
jgi:3-hydroxybutyryl-CoA dehydrogenase